MLGTVTRRRALWLALAVVLLVVAAVTTAALLQLSPLVRRAALWQLQSATGRPVTIAALDLSLADGRFSLRGLRVADRDGGVLAEVGRLEATFRPWSLLHGELWIEDLAVSGVQARIVRIGPGRLQHLRPARPAGVLRLVARRDDRPSRPRRQPGDLRGPVAAAGPDVARRRHPVRRPPPHHPGPRRHRRRLRERRGRSRDRAGATMCSSDRCTCARTSTCVISTCGWPRCTCPATVRFAWSAAGWTPGCTS